MVVHGAEGVCRLICVSQNKRQATTPISAKYGLRRSASSSRQSSTLQPDLRILCHDSIPGRTQYQPIRSVASSQVAIATLVSSSQSSGSTPSGGLSSCNQIAHTGSGSNQIPGSSASRRGG